MQRSLYVGDNGRENQRRRGAGRGQWMRRVRQIGLAAALVATTTGGAMAASFQSITFNMVRSAGVVNANVLRNAGATVRVTSLGPVEVMDVVAFGLPPNTEFDFFVIQVPDAPFGLSWYQGDFVTNRNGFAIARFVGRFSIETFTVAPNVAPAPVVHTDGPNADAPQNPAFKPIHTYHVGLWFNSPADAKKAGLTDAVTPFNGEHNAGVQVLSTRGFPADAGPLRHLAP